MNISILSVHFYPMTSQILFETFNVPALYISMQAVLSLLVKYQCSLVWPDRYCFYRAFIASARRKRGSGLVPIHKSFLTPLSRLKVLNSLALFV